MAEFLLEWLSEEIPARMQARAATDLAGRIVQALTPLQPRDLKTFHAPRRIAIAASIETAVPPTKSEERGPRVGAPEQALMGFLRKHGASEAELEKAGEYWVLRRESPSRPAASLIAETLPDLLRRFSWPKSMRWGATSNFTWVRPLRRILCVLDGEIVPFDLRHGEDDGNGLASGNLTEGHRIHAPGAFAVHGVADWQAKLRERRVIVDVQERKGIIRDGIAKLAEAQGLMVVEDEGLLDEVANLVEWPVVLLGRIDAAFMDLPEEVRQVSMRVNQRYFALRQPDGSAALFFAFVANIAAPDGGKAIIAGNERVLRARFADARHFWGRDRLVRLESRVKALDAITFHAKLGSQGDRVRRLVRLAGYIATLVGADPALAERAARLAKADLTTGMVGEFPELQGVMGRHYALHGEEDLRVAIAIRDHYAPKVPGAPGYGGYWAAIVGLADKLDILTGFFAVGERPTGSGDPYALRRAALGIIQIIRQERWFQLGLRELIVEGGQDLPAKVPVDEILDFIIERLRVQLRAEGKRHDVLAAVFRAGADDNLFRLLNRTEAVTQFLATENGANLLTAYRRAANILRIENQKDGPHDGEPDEFLFHVNEEEKLFGVLRQIGRSIGHFLDSQQYQPAMNEMSTLRTPIDAFFENVTVNDPEPELRRNRLRLLSRIRDTMNRVADFSLIEG